MKKNMKNFSNHLLVGIVFAIVLYSSFMLFIESNAWLGIFLCLIDFLGLGYYIKKQFSKQ